MPKALENFFIGIVEPDDLVRHALKTLIELDLGIETRTAGTISGLEAGLPPSAGLVVVTSSTNNIPTLSSGTLFGVVRYGNLPIDCDGLITELRRRLTQVNWG